MIEMSEDEWGEAERRHPGKTYIDQEILPMHKDRNGRRAITCLILAFLVALAWATKADMLISSAYAVCGGCYGSTPESRAAAGKRNNEGWVQQSTGGKTHYSKCSCPKNDASGSQRGGQGSNGNQGWDR